MNRANPRRRICPHKKTISQIFSPSDIYIFIADICSGKIWRRSFQSTQKDQTSPCKSEDVRNVQKPPSINFVTDREIYPLYLPEQSNIQINQCPIIILGNAPQNSGRLRSGSGCARTRRRCGSGSPKPTTNPRFHLTTPTIRWFSAKASCCVLLPHAYTGF